MNRYRHPVRGNAAPRPVMRRSGIMPIVISPLEIPHASENQTASTGYGFMLNDGSNEEAVEHSGSTQFRIQNVHQVTGDRGPVTGLTPDGTKDSPEETDAYNRIAQFRWSGVRQMPECQTTSSLGRTVPGGNDVSNDDMDAYDRMAQFRLPNVRQVSGLPQQSSLRCDSYVVANSSPSSKTSTHIDTRPIFVSSYDAGNYGTKRQNINKNAAEARTTQMTSESYVENIRVLNEQLNEEIDTKPSVVEADDDLILAPIQTTVQDVSTAPTSNFPSLNFGHSDPNTILRGTVVFQNSPSSYASDVSSLSQTMAANRTPDMLSRSQDTFAANWNQPQRPLDGRNALVSSVPGEKTDSQAIRIEQLYQLAELSSAQLIMLDPNENQKLQTLGPASLNMQQQQQQETAHLTLHPLHPNMLQNQVALSDCQNSQQQSLPGYVPTSLSVGMQTTRQKTSVTPQNILPSGSLEGHAGGAVAGQFQNQFSETSPDAFGKLVLNRSLISGHSPESYLSNTEQSNSAQILDSSIVRLRDFISSSLPSQGVQVLHPASVSQPFSSQQSQFQASATGNMDAHYQSLQTTSTLNSSIAPVPATSVSNFLPQQAPIQERPISNNQFDNSSFGISSSNLQLNEREAFLMNLLLRLCQSNSEIGNANAQAIGNLLGHMPGLGTGGLLPGANQPSVVQSPVFMQTLMLHLLPLMLRPGPQASTNNFSLLSSILQLATNPLSSNDSLSSLTNLFQNPLAPFLLPSLLPLLGLNSGPAARVESHSSHDALQTLLMFANALNPAQSIPTMPDQQRPSQPATSPVQLFEQLMQGSGVSKATPAPQVPLNLFELLCPTQMPAATNDGSKKATGGKGPADLPSASASKSTVGVVRKSGTPVSSPEVKSCYVSMGRLPTGKKTPQRQALFTECEMEGSRSSRASPGKSPRKTNRCPGNKQTGSLNQARGSDPLYGGYTSKMSHYGQPYSDEESEEHDSAPGVYVDVALDGNCTDQQPHHSKSDGCTVAELLKLSEIRNDCHEPGGVHQGTIDFKNIRPGEVGQRGRSEAVGLKRTLAKSVESDSSSKRLKGLKAPSPGRNLPALSHSGIVDSKFPKTQKAVRGRTVRGRGVRGRGGKRELNPRSSVGHFAPKVSADVEKSEHMSGRGQGGRGRGRGGSRGRGGKCIGRGRGRGRGNVSEARGKSGPISGRNVEEVVFKRIVVESCDAEENSDAQADNKSSSSDNSDFMDVSSISSSGSDEDYVATKTKSKKSKQKTKFRGFARGRRGRGRGQLSRGGFAADENRNTSDRSPKREASSFGSDTTSMSNNSRAAPNSSDSTGERPAESDGHPGRGRPSLFSLFPALPSKVAPETKAEKEGDDRVKSRDPEMPMLVRETTHREVARVAPLAAPDRTDHLLKDRIQSVALASNVNGRMNFSVQMIYCQLIESLQTMNILLGLKTDNHLSFQCSFCPFSDAVIKSVSVHVCKEHSDFVFATAKAPMPTGDVLYLCCRHCDFISHDRLSMWIHFEVYHGVPDILLGSAVTQVHPPASRRVILKRETPFLVPMFFECFDCGFLVAEDRHMAEHIVKDHGDSSPNYQGCFCRARVVSPPKSVPAGVTYEELLTNKYAEFHNDVYLCIRCSYRAYTPLLAITHHIFSHLQMQMVFICNVEHCENRENDPASCIKHCKSHHLSEPDVKMQCSVTVVSVSDDLASLRECPVDNRKGAVLCFTTKRAASHKLYESSDHK